MRAARSQPRVVFAAKTALAASVAWLLAPHVPFVDAHYSYYAPLGAVVSMHPTLVRSVRTAIQALTGLTVGAAVAFATLPIGGPGVIKVALVVGVGVLLAGVRALGAGRDWVPITGLFVLLIGGVDADEYSVNYLVHMVLGVIVGVTVNLVIAPPLYVGTAESRINGLRDLAAERMREVADWVRHHPAGTPELSQPMTDLGETARSVRDAVREADESRRGNPRARGAATKIDEEYERLRALERVLFFLRDLTDVLGGSGPARSGEGAGDRSPSWHGRVEELSAAIDEVAGLVGADAYGDQSRDRLTAAEFSLSTLDAALDRGERPSVVADEVAAAACLRRIVDAARPFVA